MLKLHKVPLLWHKQGENKPVARINVSYMSAIKPQNTDFFLLQLDVCYDLIFYFLPRLWSDFPWFWPLQKQLKMIRLHEVNIRLWSTQKQRFPVGRKTVLVATKTAGDCPTFVKNSRFWWSQKCLEVLRFLVKNRRFWSPQKWYEMVWLVSWIASFGHHKNVNFPWEERRFKSIEKCLEMSPGLLKRTPQNSLRWSNSM